MITPDKKVFTLTEVEELLGDYVHDSLFYPIVGTVEKAPDYISKYIVESSSELKIYKRQKGLHIQLRDSLKSSVNFIILDDHINEIVWQENQSDRSKPKLSGGAVVVSIIFMFLVDGVLNKSRLLFLPLFLGLFLGMLISLFISDSRKKMVTILAGFGDEHDVLIMSGIRSSQFKAFFREYYKDKCVII